MDVKKTCIAVALVVSGAAYGKPLAYPGVTNGADDVVDSAIDSGISVGNAATTSYAGSVLETMREMLKNSSTPEAAILPDYLGKSLKWGGASVSGWKAWTEWKNGAGWEALYQALKAGSGFIPKSTGILGFKLFLLQMGMEVAHLAGECTAHIVWGLKKLSDKKPMNAKHAKTAPESGQKSRVHGIDGYQEKESDGQCCSCKDPAPNITLPPFAPGWARCDKCNKFIGVVMMDKNGDVYVSGGNRVANEMVKDMVKKVRGKGKK